MICLSLLVGDSTGRLSHPASVSSRACSAVSPRSGGGSKRGISRRTGSAGSVICLFFMERPLAFVFFYYTNFSAVCTECKKGGVSKYAFLERESA